MCLYTTPNSSTDNGLHENAGSPKKRRHVEESPALIKIETSIPPSSDTLLTSPAPTPGSATWKRHSSELNGSSQAKVEFDIPTPSIEPDQTLGTLSEDGFAPSAHTRHSTASGPEDEGFVFDHRRMLQDPTGRLRKSNQPLACLLPPRLFGMP